MQIFFLYHQHLRERNLKRQLLTILPARQKFSPEGSIANWFRGTEKYMYKKIFHNWIVSFNVKRAHVRAFCRHNFSQLAFPLKSRARTTQSRYKIVFERKRTHHIYVWREIPSWCVMKMKENFNPEQLNSHSNKNYTRMKILSNFYVMLDFSWWWWRELATLMLSRVEFHLYKPLKFH